MIKNYKATIVRDLLVDKPVAFCGGVTKNRGVIRAIKEVFSLQENELIVPTYASFAGAVGAALHASGSFTSEQLFLAADHMKESHHGSLSALPASSENTLFDPACTQFPVSGKCALGIDIGSTSTDLVIIGEHNELVDYQYLRTAGNPEAAVRKGLASIKERFGELVFQAVGESAWDECLARMQFAMRSRRRQQEQRIVCQRSIRYLRSVDRTANISILRMDE